MAKLLACSLGIVLLLLAADDASAVRCGGGFDATLAAARDRCCPAETHGAYVSCATRIANGAVRRRALRAACKQRVLQAGCGGATTSTVPPTTTTVTTAPTTSTTGTTAPPTSTTTSAAPTTTSSTAPASTSTTATTSTTVPGTTSTTTPGTTSTTTPPPTTTSTTAAPTTTTLATTTTIATTTTTIATTSTTAATTSTTVATTSTTTTTTPPACAPVVRGAPISSTYQLLGTTGENRCTTNAGSNRFGPCTSDANCGGTGGSCLPLPWVTADGQVMAFPTGVETTFTVTNAGSFPT
ncbi:MAG TPA: hypothetical protein VKA21_00945, partial [Candidatus Binatia bacterium]|nr:hypothetical protein [Candidatus Binatia bacterium]